MGGCGGFLCSFGSRYPWRDNTHVLLGGDAQSEEWLAAAGAGALAMDYGLPAASFAMVFVPCGIGIGSVKRGEVQRWAKGVVVSTCGASAAGNFWEGGWRWKSGSAFVWKRMGRRRRILM